MKGFPKEINAEVLKNLSGKEILSLCGTSKSFKTVCSEDPKYNSLWKLKIEEEFQEIYTGKSAFAQYKYLSKLFKQYFYLLYYSDDDQREEDLIGIYNMYSKAVMGGINYIQENLEDNAQIASLESIKYLFWNDKKIRWNDYNNLKIVRTHIDKVVNIIDERKFFQDRENLYIKVFGKSSEGASSKMSDPFQFTGSLKQIAEEKRKIKKSASYPVLFFLLLDEAISEINKSGNYIIKEKVMEKFNILKLNLQQIEIIKGFILENIFQPKEIEIEREDKEDDLFEEIEEIDGNED